MHSDKYNPATQPVIAADAWFYEEKQPFRRRLLCAVAALIGMLIGLVPSLLYGLWTQTSYPLFFFCIPLGCLLFVQIFGCRDMKSAVYWILGFTVLGWYLAEVLATSVSFASVYKIPLYELPRLMYYMLANGLLWKTITGESVYSFLFLIFGAWIAFEYTRGGHSSKGSDSVRPQKVKKRPASEEIEEAEVQVEENSVSETNDSAEETTDEPAKENGTAPGNDDDENDGFEFETREQFMQNKN